MARELKVEAVLYMYVWDDETLEDAVERLKSKLETVHINWLDSSMDKAEITENQRRNAYA